MVLRAGEYPLAEAGERARYRGDSDVAENFSAFYSLPAHVPPNSCNRFLTAVTSAAFLALCEMQCQVLKTGDPTFPVPKLTLAVSRVRDHGASPMQITEP
jgi:hypothetical protein